MKICIVSDSHDHSGLLAAAVKAAAAQGAQAVIHCGDVIGANTLRALQSTGLPVHVVHVKQLPVDPGTVAGLSAPATCTLSDLATLEFSIEQVLTVRSSH